MGAVAVAGRLAVLALAVITAAAAAAGCRPAPAAARPDADTLFASVCARCHGLDGKGGRAADGGVAPQDFHDVAFQARRTDAQLRASIRGGKNGRMPAFAALVDEEQLDGLVARVRSFAPRTSKPAAQQEIP